VDSVKCLGINFISSKTFTLDLSQMKRKYFGCVNSILNHSCGASELVKLHLLENYCYPVLSYALECFNLKSACIQHLNACWNSAYRRIFGFKPWESVRELISCLERMNLEFLYYQKKLLFWNNMLCSDNSIIVAIMDFFIYSIEYNKLCSFADVTPYECKGKIRRCVNSKFLASIR